MTTVTPVSTESDDDDDDVFEAGFEIISTINSGLNLRIKFSNPNLRTRRIATKPC